ERTGLFGVRPGRERDLGMERHLGEAHDAVHLVHRALGLVLVGDDVDARPSAESQVAQAMARRKGGHEEVLWVVERRVPAKGRGCRAAKRRLPWNVDSILTGIAFVARGGSLGGAGPHQAA